MCMLCRSLFVLLSFFFRPLCCLSFYIRILITPLASSNTSFSSACVCSIYLLVDTIFQRLCLLPGYTWKNIAANYEITEPRAPSSTTYLPTYTPIFSALVSNGQVRYCHHVAHGNQTWFKCSLGTTWKSCSLWCWSEIQHCSQGQLYVLISWNWRIVEEIAVEIGFFY